MSNGIISRDSRTQNIDKISQFRSLAKPSQLPLSSSCKAVPVDRIRHKAADIKKISKVAKEISKVIKTSTRFPIALNDLVLPQEFLSETIYDYIKKTICSSKIKQYFELELPIRVQKRKEYANYIKSVNNVFEVLQLGNTKGIVEAYDGAIDILAECDKNVIVEAVEVARDRYISYTNQEIAQSWQKNWEILIKGLVCAVDVESHKKMTLILSLCDPQYKLSRLIKITLIDAIVDLDIDKDLVEVMLQIFLSKRELDDFVRNYAKESIECL